MKNINEIGLDITKSRITADKLNQLLANYSVFYQNTRGLHWNIKGEKFFELHEKFEELYDDLQEKVDEVAERILALGQVPEHTYSKYIEVSVIPECKRVSDAKMSIEHILDSFSILLSIQREILEIAAEAKDEGTVALMSDYIKQQEKQVWMYSSFLSK